MPRPQVPSFVFSSSGSQTQGSSPARKRVPKPPATPTTYHRPLRMQRPTLLRPDAHVPRRKRALDMDDSDGYGDGEMIYETEWGESNSGIGSPDPSSQLPGDDDTPASTASPSLFDSQPPTGYKVLERVRPKKTPSKHADTRDGFLRGEAIPLRTPARTLKRKSTESSPLLGSLEMVSEGLQTQAEQSRSYGTPMRGRFRELQPLTTGSDKKRRVAFTDGMDGFTQEEMGICKPMTRKTHGKQGKESPRLSNELRSEKLHVELPKEIQVVGEELKAAHIETVEEGPEQLVPAVDREVSCTPGLKEATKSWEERRMAAMSSDSETGMSHNQSVKP